MFHLALIICILLSQSAMSKDHNTLTPEVAHTPEVARQFIEAWEEDRALIFFIKNRFTFTHSWYLSDHQQGLSATVITPGILREERGSQLGGRDPRVPSPFCHLRFTIGYVFMMSGL